MNDPTSAIDAIQYAQVTGSLYPLSIEYQWLNPELKDAPIAVFLHEGLGSIALWKDWPQSLCDRLGCRGLVYSRPGYGRSTPRRADEHWAGDFLHHQAQVVLPALLDAIGINESERARMWIIGHSDGGSIALLYASAYPESLAGVAVLAPHVFVEPMTVQAITRHEALMRAAPCARGLSPTIRTWIPLSMVGTTHGWIPRSFIGTLRRRSNPSAGRCSPFKATTTNTRPCSRSTRSRQRFLTLISSNCRAAVIRLTATQPKQ